MRGSDTQVDDTQLLAATQADEDHDMIDNDDEGMDAEADMLSQMYPRVQEDTVPETNESTEKINEADKR